MMQTEKQRFSGCLIGQALGDAIGFMVEGQTAQECAEFVENDLLTGEVVRQSRGEFSFGQYTDDTQLARELMCSFVDHGKIVPKDYAARIADLFETHRIIGRGRATGAAARKLLNGAHWRNSGAPAPLAGNGSAMRAAPIGLMYFDREGALIQAACDQSYITHQDPRCLAGSITIAAATALAMTTKTIKPAIFLKKLARLVHGTHAGFADAIEHLIDWCALEPAEAVAEIRVAGLETSDGMCIDRWEGVSPYVIPSVLWSLYSFLQHPTDFLGAIGTAIAAGGDVDTTASLTGALVGARVGLDELPNHLIPHLTDHGEWGDNELIDLADECYSRVTACHVNT